MACAGRCFISLFIVVDFMTLLWMVTGGHRAVPAGVGSDFRGWRYSTTSFSVWLPWGVTMVTK